MNEPKVTIDNSFPSKRNGCRHAEFGDGVITSYPYENTEKVRVIKVRFDKFNIDFCVPCDSLTSLPSRGISPDPATSRNSGWMGMNNYKK
jgi:hypothetical protein